MHSDRAYNMKLMVDYAMVRWLEQLNILCLEAVEFIRS